MLEAETVVEKYLELAADAVAVGPWLDEHVRREGRELGCDLPDVEVVHLHTPWWEAIAVPISSTGSPAGAMSSSTRPESRSSRQEALSISAATNSAATGSARTQPVARITPPATAVAMKA